MSLVDEMREIAERCRLMAPWVEWARQNPVALQLSDYVPPCTAYVLRSEWSPHTAYMVVAHADLFRVIRRLLPDHATFPMRDQEIAEMIAWHKAELVEPSEPRGGPR